MIYSKRDWRKLMQKPKRDKRIRTTMLEDGHVVLVYPDSNWVHTLSPLGGLVWEFCDGETTVDEIVAKISSIPGIVSRDSLSVEVAGLIRQFDEDGFLCEN
jgi:Coenzyme PQQ synthesis protein D (PqqD)